MARIQYWFGKYRRVIVSMNHHIYKHKQNNMAVKTAVSKLVLVVALCPLLRSKSSFFDIEEIEKLKYGVEIMSEPVLLDQDAGKDIMHITSKHGQKYQCVLPILHVKGDENNSRNVTTDEIRVLLQPLNTTCLYLLDGWWTYKVCFEKSVNQYHEEGSEVKDNISLGHFAGDTDWSTVANEKNSSNSERYHSQFYSNGDVCDLTGDLRKTEVRYFCDPNVADYIARIDESSTCVYVITVYTNKLCNHVLFRPDRFPTTQSITCSPALMEEQFKTYSKFKTKEVEHVSVGDTKSDNKKEVENKPKKQTPSIFEALAKLFDKGAREKKGDNKDDDEKIDWEDVFKTSRGAIDKSVEQIRKLNLHEKLQGGQAADDTEEIIDTEKSSEAPLQPGGEPERSKNDYNIAKEKSGKKSEYYQKLIDDLKIQHKYFKTQMDIITNDMHNKIERFEKSSKVNGVVLKQVERIKDTVRRFEETQRAVDNEMKHLTDLNDAVTQDPNYSKAKDEIAGIRKRLKRLMAKMAFSKRRSLNDETGSKDEASIQDDNEKNFKDKRGIEDSKKQDKTFVMGNPRLDKVVSKLKNIMTYEGNEELEDGESLDNGDMFDDDRISVRVTKIKNSEQDLLDETDESLYADDSDSELEEINENQKMKAATRKMESIVRKQLQEAGIEHQVKVKVKIITSKEDLKRVAGGHTGFQILTPRETDEFKYVLSNLLGVNQEFMKEKERQDKLEDNYNLVWNQEGFALANKDSENNDEKR